MRPLEWSEKFRNFDSCEDGDHEKKNSESRQGKDEICEELAPGTEIAATLGNEGGPNIKTQMTRKKKLLNQGEKTANQLNKEFNLETIPNQ